MNNYKAPTLPTLLISISFFFLLQVFRILFQRLFGVGLLGEITLGIIYSITNLLPKEWEITFQVVGYLGLILIVFESGLDFNPTLFLSTIRLATLTALIGIILPIAFTFALFSNSNYSISTYESFIIGAALSSTSLGTTLHILKSTFEGELIKTKLGSILISAALLDDIISLVLLSVIQSLGDESSNSLGWTIGRALLAAIVLTAFVPLIIYWIIKPVLKRIKWEEERIEQVDSSILFSIGVVVLSAFLSISYYAGTTVLLGAYLAGVFLSLPSISAQNAFRKAYSRVLEVQNYIFVPLFFASIGYSIPFLSLWEGQIVWKGIVYSLVMLLGKFLAGTSIILSDLFAHRESVEVEEEVTKVEEITCSTRMEKVRRPVDSISSFSTSSTSSFQRWNFMTRVTLVPAILLGTALIARGEIGLIILQIAYNSPNSSLGTEAYLIGIWAVLLCTLFGPILFSVLIKRYGKDVLVGKWG